MDRRTWLKMAGAATAATVLPRVALVQERQQPVGFSEDWLDAFAKALSEQAYRPPEKRLHRSLGGLSYEQYRDIRYKPDRALWRDDNLPFRVEMFHTGGSFYSFPVEIFTVESGRASPVSYGPDQFTFGPLVEAPPPESSSGFAGFRVLTELNKPSVFDDFLSFLGASYFRARGAGQTFGQSARGLAINTGQTGGEEFPLFRSFWIERPMPGMPRITVYALLDSISATGRYKFVATPGRDTLIDVEAVIFPRRALSYVGVAPLTSMFFFGPNQPPKRTDFRPRVHDSDTLSIRTGAGEAISRALINPERLQFSVFIDRNPKGYGLFQDTRLFSDFQDLNAQYESRPSLWVEPLGEWGGGAVELIELPAREETNDNIVTFWRPANGLEAGQAHRFQYRLHWGWDAPIRNDQATVSQTRLGQTRGGSPLFVVDFAKSDTCGICTQGALTPDLSATSGEIKNAALVRNPILGGHRLTFEYEPQGLAPADLRCVLRVEGKPASETWIYRWAP